MVKQAKGFLAKDGTFFTEQVAAELYEAEKELSELLEEAGFDPDKYLTLLEKFYEQTIRWLEAKRQTGSGSSARTVESFSRQGTGTDTGTKPVPATPDQANDKGREDRVAPVQQQQGSKRKPVPDVGSGKRAEKIQDTGKKPRA